MAPLATVVAAAVPWTKTTPAEFVVVMPWPTVRLEPPAVEVVRITPPTPVVVAVAVRPEIVPVQTAPCGQQAMWPAVSAEQIALLLQQREDPLFSQAQDVEPLGHEVWRLRRSSRGSVALPIEKSESESENGSRNGRNCRFDLEMEAEV